MASQGTSRTGGVPRRRWLWFVPLLVSASVAVWGFARFSRQFSERFEEEARRRGWRVEGGVTERTRFSLTRRGASLSLRGAPGVRAWVDRIEIKTGPFASPSVTIGRLRAELRGEPGALLDAILAALPNGESGLVPARLDIDYRHPRLGAVKFEEVTIAARGTGFVLRARRAEAGGRTFPAVALSVERRKDMLLVAVGESATESRLQLSCFPAQDGSTRWLVSVLHQELRPLADALGWNLGADFDATKVAGAFTLELPESPNAAVEGRLSLVFDSWPMAAPAEAEPMLGTTVSFLSNVVFDGDLSSGRMPRLEIKLPVFSLVGAGQVKLAPSLRLEAEGERTCAELAALVPPSEARELAKHASAHHQGGAVGDGSALRARLAVRVDTQGSPGQTGWIFEPGCGLPAWATLPR